MSVLKLYRYNNSFLAIAESRQINRKNKEGSGIHARGEESVSQIIRRNEAALRRDKRMPIARAILAVSRCPPLQKLAAGHNSGPEFVVAVAAQAINGTSTVAVQAR